MDLLRKIETSGDTETQAKGWKLIFELCLQKGMKKNNTSGIESVVNFIENNLKNN